MQTLKTLATILLLAASSIAATTAPDWEREIWVGNVREFSLKNTPINQVVFGVKFVDRKGHESPAAGYWTQPRRTHQ